MYTEQQVSQRLCSFRAKNMSLRSIARLVYGGAITYGDVQRGMLGVFPKDPHKRLALNLPAIVETVACPECGQVHKIDGVCVAHSIVNITVVEVDAEEYAKIDRPVTITIKRRARKDTRPRATINTANPESAAKTIRRKMDAGTLAALVELLKETE